MKVAGWLPRRLPTDATMAMQAMVVDEDDVDDGAGCLACRVACLAKVMAAVVVWLFLS